MAYLDTYTEKLTEKTAAHLLRRATFGPTKGEIKDFIGLTSAEAVRQLFENVSLTIDSSEPVDLDATKPTAGRPYMNLPFDRTRSYVYSVYVRYWWIGLMASQSSKPSILEKLTAFWQNHFVVSQQVVVDYRLAYRYVQLLRQNCLGNFRDMAKAITKDGAMLIFQNGNENQNISPNENYARELQELFVVGQKDFYGNTNYTEEDVKAAARVLTGWQVSNYWVQGSTSCDVVFNAGRHDTADKLFSAKYNNRTIYGRSGVAAGDLEMSELIDMLVEHPESPKHICRKLYRWFVNPNVTQEIEDNVIIPLANFFKSPSNNFNVQAVLEKLLTSEIFYGQANIGAIIKSPAEFVIGMLRHFEQPVPNITTEPGAFSKYMLFVWNHMASQQLNLLYQPLVFGSVPYYQTGFSKNWINSATIARRTMAVSNLLNPYLEIKPGYILGVDVVSWVTALQPNFSDLTTPAITCEVVLEAFSKNLFVHDLGQSQKDFLIDKIMMSNLGRANWIREWNRYRGAPEQPEFKTTVSYRCRMLMRQMLNMAEFQVF
jgi:uncharacterized protein (DUF1800 family)